MEGNLNNNIEVNNQLNGMNYNINPNKKNNKLLIILVVAAILIIAIVLLTLFVFKKDDKSNNNDNNNENTSLVEKEITKEEVEELIEPFKSLYFDKYLENSIIYNDYYDFDSIPNELKINLAFYNIDWTDKHELTKSDIDESLRDLFGNDIDLSDLKYPPKIESWCFEWNDSKEAYERPIDCPSSQTNYNVRSKIIDIKESKDELIISVKYILWYSYQIDDPNDPDAMFESTIYSDGNSQNIIVEKARNVDISQLLDQGDLYKIVFTKDDDNHYFESMEKQIDDDLGESLLNNDEVETTINILTNLLEGSTTLYVRNYKEFDTEKPIVNTTFTMKELRNKKKLYSTDISDYIKIISISDNYLIKDSVIKLTEEEFNNYACKGYGKLGYCKNGIYEEQGTSEVGSYSLNQVKDMYKTGVSNINSFYSDHKDGGCSNEIFHVLTNDQKIIHLQDSGGGDYSYANLYTKIIDVKKDDKTIKVYVKPLQYYLDKDFNIYAISNLMDNNIIKILPVIETVSVVATPLNFSQIINLFKKYDDKLETLAFTFEKNSNGIYVFDYVELVD